MLHEELSGKIIGAYFHVYNSLGVGFLEKVYENALRNVLRKSGLQVEQQKKLDVYFEGDTVGEYYADLVVNGLIILELKASIKIVPEYEAQLINYLKSSTIELGLLFNFGSSKPEYDRKVFSNENKVNLRAQA
jgi:GxxExxY protein